MATTTDRPARQQATRQALETVQADAPLIPLFFSIGAFAYRPSAYDGWTFVKGSGILDKRSFEAAAARPAPEGLPEVVEEAPPGRRSPRGPGAIGAAGAFVAALVLAAVALLGRPRR